MADFLGQHLEGGVILTLSRNGSDIPICQAEIKMDQISTSLVTGG